MPDPNDESFAYNRFDIKNLIESPSKIQNRRDASHDSIELHITEVDGIHEEFIDKYMSQRSY